MFRFWLVELVQSRNVEKSQLYKTFPYESFKRDFSRQGFNQTIIYIDRDFNFSFDTLKDIWVTYSTVPCVISF